VSHVMKRCRPAGAGHERVSAILKSVQDSCGVLAPIEDASAIAQGIPRLVE